MPGLFMTSQTALQAQKMAALTAAFCRLPSSDLFYKLGHKSTGKKLLRQHLFSVPFLSVRSAMSLRFISPLIPAFFTQRFLWFVSYSLHDLRRLPAVYVCSHRSAIDWNESPHLSRTSNHIIISSCCAMGGRKCGSPSFTPPPPPTHTH